MGLIEGILSSLFPPHPEGVAELQRGRWGFVRGRVVPRDLITSPLTGNRGVYYRYLVEEWRRSAITAFAYDGVWSATEQDECICEFYLQDDSGRVLIAPHRARVLVSRELSPSLLERTSSHRAFETVIRPGDLVEVAGRVDEAEDVFDDDRGYRNEAACLVLHGTAGRPLTIRLVARGDGE